MSELYKSLLKVQSKIGSVKKDEKNPFFKSSYATLNAVRDSVIDVLTANDLVLLQPTIALDGKQYVSTRIIHAPTGQSVESQTEIVAKNPGDAQQVGSGISYARRYGLMSMLCLAAEDDDGNAASAKLSGQSLVVNAGPTTVAISNSATTLSPAPAKKVSFANTKKIAAVPAVTAEDEL